MGAEDCIAVFSRCMSYCKQWQNCRNVAPHDRFLLWPMFTIFSFLCVLYSLQQVILFHHICR